ncbi:MAG: hypothetical protein ACP5R5_03030 [Armatimonadota bacterium]
MELVEDLLGELEHLPAVDVHSGIRIASPGASDFSQIALCQPLWGDLECAGVSPAVFEADALRSRPHEASAALALISNTTNYWCLSRILGDLYQVGPPHKSDLAELANRIESYARRPGWANEVLDRANVSKVFVTCDWRKPVPKASERFVPVLRVDSLVNEAHVPRTLESLTEATVQSIYEAADLKKAVDELFRRARDAGAVAASASFEPQVDFEQGDRDTADRVLSLVLLGQRAGRDDRKSLRSYVLDQVLRNCAEYGMPMQLMLGIKQMRSSDRTISAYDPGAVSMYAELFERHTRVTFDVFASHMTTCRELAAAARRYPNVMLSGTWRYLAFPTHFRESLRERIEMLPMTRCCALASEAMCVEWVYGRAKLLRREMALVLAQLVEEGYLSKDAALNVGAHYLAENPKAVYGL